MTCSLYFHENMSNQNQRWHKLTFDPNTKSLSDFMEELNKCGERSFGDKAQQVIDSLIYAELPPHLK